MDRDNTFKLKQKWLKYMNSMYSFMIDDAMVRALRAGRC
jgi:hypothetical protein